MWWSVSTLLTIGYGDIYPITPAGKAMGIFITFLGVGMVAIPTGIISAGFVEQYTRLKRLGDYAEEEDLHFIKTELHRGDLWVGKTVRDLHLPQGMILAVIQRGSDTIIPRGDVALKAGDRLVIGAEHMKGDQPVNLREITLRKNHDWNGVAIKDIDISRQSFIVMVRRGKKLIVPYGKLVLNMHAFVCGTLTELVYNDVCRTASLLCVVVVIPVQCKIADYARKKIFEAFGFIGRNRIPRIYVCIIHAFLRTLV